MAYPTQDELIQCDPEQPWIDQHFLRGDPFAFEGIGFRDFVMLVTAELGVDPNGVFCVGSGAVGISLNPKNINNKTLSRFTKESTERKASDLDIAIISEVHFEKAWRDLREAAQPTLTEVHPLIVEHISWQKKKLFDGAILANVILPTLSFGKDWIASIERISEWVAKSFGYEVDVNVWIYRDYWSVRNYVAASIVTCRKYLV